MIFLAAKIWRAALDRPSCTYEEGKAKQLRWPREIHHQRIGKGQVMSAIGSHFETAFALAVNTVRLHQLLHSILADTNAISQQSVPNPRPSVAATTAQVRRTDVDEQCNIADATLLASQ